MLVLKDLFDFVTSVLRSGATIRTYQTLAGYQTTYVVLGNKFFNSFLCYYLLIISFLLTGDGFVAKYDSIDNFVADNKREAGAIFLNHLIDVGAVITAGPRFQRYVESLDLGRWGHYNVHNARSSLENHLGSNNIIKREYGVPGRYRCNLKFPRYGEGNNLFEI
jgi:hypothetical protein